MLTQILPHCWVLRCLLFGACIFLSPTFPLGCCQLRAPLPLPSVFWLLLSSAFEHIPSTWVTSVCLPFGAVGLPLRVLISSSPCSSCTLSLCIIVHSLSSHLSDLFSVSFPCVWVHVSLRLHPAPLPSSCVTPAENQFPVLSLWLPFFTHRLLDLVSVQQPFTQFLCLVLPLVLVYHV